MIDKQQLQMLGEDISQAETGKFLGDASGDASPWISINDKFPNGGQVIVRFIKPFFGVPNACYDMGYFEDPDKTEDCFSGWFYWKDDKPITYPVTHWMPLQEFTEHG